jgi:hypothetical protein
MAMGRAETVQGDLMATWAEMPRSPGHAFYDRLQELLQEAGFNVFVEGYLPCPRPAHRCPPSALSPRSRRSAKPKMPGCRSRLGSAATLARSPAQILDDDHAGAAVRARAAHRTRLVRCDIRLLLRVGGRRVSTGPLSSPRPAGRQSQRASAASIWRSKISGAGDPVPRTSS